MKSLATYKKRKVKLDGLRSPILASMAAAAAPLLLQDRSGIAHILLTQSAVNLGLFG